MRVGTMLTVAGAAAAFNRVPFSAFGSTPSATVASRLDASALPRNAYLRLLRPWVTLRPPDQGQYSRQVRWFRARKTPFVKALGRTMPNSNIEARCVERGLKMTGQRRVIARVLSDSDDHPDVELVYRRASELDPKISIATVYRTVRLFEEAKILEKHDFGDGRARYEELTDEHHDHLIDVRTGDVIEFTNVAIEKLQEEIAREHGYKLVGHRLELYGVPLDQPGPDGGD